MSGYKNTRDITEEDKVEISRLSKLTTATMGDKKSMEIMIRRYIDDKFTLCQVCDDQVRLAHSRIKNLYNKI